MTFYRNSLSSRCLGQLTSLYGRPRRIPSARVLLQESKERVVTVPSIALPVHRNWAQIGRD
jgi:hypothetical protein